MAYTFPGGGTRNRAICALLGIPMVVPCGILNHRVNACTYPGGFSLPPAAVTAKPPPLDPLSLDLDPLSLVVVSSPSTARGPFCFVSPQGDPAQVSAPFGSTSTTNVSSPDHSFVSSIVSGIMTHMNTKIAKAIAVSTPQRNV